ncbi:hypothetical protein C2845_PM08G16150 [Panicum miliaceum]|uniref:Uncharacterized protein n=1 Tax=Panicum miliaceum TaxID=4540 RepID=A0A3L6QZT2_PANMI|nr:hypothetical protein C2845_PM08G16150 [Panicum miliaceum]
MLLQVVENQQKPLRRGCAGSEVLEQNRTEFSRVADRNCKREIPHESRANIIVVHRNAQRIKHTNGEINSKASSSQMGQIILISVATRTNHPTHERDSRVSTRGITPPDTTTR